MAIKFTSEVTEHGVTERLFDLLVGGDAVPGVLWTPEGASGPRPLVLMGHGGSQHKQAPGIAGGARRFAKDLGYAVAALDAPGHGARVTPEEAKRFGEQFREQIGRAGGMGGEALENMMQRAVQAEVEWRTALDALQALDVVGAGGPVGYLGLSMGAIAGIQFVAHEARIKAAVFGLAGVREETHALAQAARAITVPLEFALQWDDEMIAREAGIALFDAFGSREKTMHANRGGHAGIPPFEHLSWKHFFTRHLGVAV